MDYLFLEILILLSLGDIGFTCYTISRLRKKRRFKNRWINVEGNFIVRTFWRRFGFIKGTLLTIPIVISALTIVVYSNPPEFAKGFLIGMYVSVYVIHIYNFQALKYFK